MDNNDLYLAFENLRDAVTCEPQKRLAKRMFKELEERWRVESLVNQLHKTRSFKDAPQSFMLSLMNRVDEPFVRLMLTLKGYRMIHVAMHIWWRGLKAIDRNNLVTYFNLAEFQRTHYKGSAVGTSDIMENLVKNEETLRNISESIGSKYTIETSLRAKLGISGTSDIETAWKRFAMVHHPDKGGDIELFITTKAAYEAWKEMQ